MGLKLFDLHCDTATVNCKKEFPLDSSPSSVSLDKADVYDEYCQVMAIWADDQIKSDEDAFFAFHEAADYLMAEFERLDDKITYVRSANGLLNAKTKAKAFLSVEDARSLCGRLDRLEIMYARGVRFLTPLWAGETIIGGAHDTSSGLTDFGREVVKKCHEIGVITDISHASEKSAEEMIELAKEYGKTIFASHSNSYSVCKHTRNLKDYQFKEIKELGGVVGISLHGPHIVENGKATIADVISHVEYYMSLGGENVIVFGSDFDGTDSLPDGITDIGDLTKIADELARLNYTENIINKIFYQNAKDFVLKNVK